MPKFYRQNKKRIDPRYFLHEKIEEAHDQDEENMKRASALAQVGMKGEIPPWENDDANLGIFDGHLQDGTDIKSVLQSVRSALNIPGGRAVLEKFDQLLSEMGVDLGEAPVPGSGVDVPESEAERSASGPSKEEIDHQWYGPSGHPYDK